MRFNYLVRVVSFVCSDTSSGAFILFCCWLLTDRLRAKRGSMRSQPGGTRSPSLLAWLSSSKAGSLVRWYGIILQNNSRERRITEGSIEILIKCTLDNYRCSCPWLARIYVMHRRPILHEFGTFTANMPPAFRDSLAEMLLPKTLRYVLGVVPGLDDQ